jgi:hypothetical protein
MTCSSTRWYTIRDERAGNGRVRHPVIQGQAMGVVKRQEKIPVGASHDQLHGSCKRAKQQKTIKKQGKKIQTATTVMFT